MLVVPIMGEGPIFHPVGVLFGHSKHLFTVDDKSFLEEFRFLNDSNDNDIFRICIDIQPFLPEEVTVKVSEDRYIFIEGIHQEKNDKQGESISRHFMKKVHLSEEYNINEVLAKISSNGLIITAPKLKNQESKFAERKIIISQTEKSANGDNNGGLKHKL